MTDAGSLAGLSDYLAYARTAPAPQVILLCGTTGSGKTTLAAELEQALPGIRFGTDAWMIELFGHHMTRALFDARDRSIKELQWGMVERLVALGVHVVLDYGFWSADQRADAARRVAAAGGEPVLIYLDVPVATLLQRLERRNANLPPGTFEVTSEMLELFLAKFEPPSNAEPLKIIEIRDDEQAVARS